MFIAFKNVFIIVNSIHIFMDFMIFQTLYEAVQHVNKRLLLSHEFYWEQRNAMFH